MQFKSIEEEFNEANQKPEKEKKGTKMIGSVTIDSLEIATTVRKSKIPYDEIFAVLESNQAYVFEGSRNAIFNISQKLQEKYKTKTVFAKLKNGQFAIFRDLL